MAGSVGVCACADGACQPNLFRLTDVSLTGFVAGSDRAFFSARPRRSSREVTMSKKRSDIIHSSASLEMNLFREGLLKGAGYRAETLKKRPLIAIANSHSELTTGHSHLDRLAAKVKEGILAAGGECAEFNVPAPCDGVAMAHDGMRYVLAQRDLIADMVETHMRSQPFDGLVAISGCDKIN